MKILFSGFIVALFVFSGCSKDLATDLKFPQAWEVKEFMSIESVAYAKNENTKLLLTFKRSVSYNLMLDFNSCGGNYESGNSNQLKIGSPART